MTYTTRDKRGANPASDMPTQESASEKFWKWLSRINTVRALAVAALGGTALSAALHVVLSLLSRPTIPWWGYLAVTAVCSVLAYSFFPRSTPSVRTGKIEAKKERLTVRIMEGYFGRQWNDPNTQLVVLNVKVDGEPALVKKWRLDLERDGEHWQTGFQNPMSNPTMIEEWTGRTDLRWAFKLTEQYKNPPPLGNQREPLPDIQLHDAKPAFPVLTQFMPREGWVLFRVENASQRFSELVFTATFVLRVVEGAPATCRQPAAEWLHRALIGYP